MTDGRRYPVLAGGALVHVVATLAPGDSATGLVVGMGWALVPAAVAVGRAALGDEPAAFVAGLFLLGTWLAARPRATSPRQALAGEDHRASGGRAAAAGGGLAFGL